jgi:hypothetical protein
MSDLSYRDHCRITRPTGEYDKFDNPLTEEIYNGVCDFQPGEQTRGMIAVRINDKIYISGVIRTVSGDMISNGDMIEWRTESGRKFNGVIDEVNDVKIELDGSWVTEIEIKQSTEKQLWQEA